jgi:hypothetical protein
VKAFEPLIGEWHGDGEIPIDPPMKISEEAKVERLGRFIVFSSVGEPAEVPGEISADGRTIEGRWERGMGDVGDQWEIDVPLTYVRKERTVS